MIFFLEVPDNLATAVRGQWLVENHPTKPSKAEWTETLVLKLTVGNFFGEIALLSGKPRQATVKAVGDVAVLVLSRDAFTRLCGNLFEILRRNMSTYSSMELPPEEEPQPGMLSLLYLQTTLRSRKPARSYLGDWWSRRAGRGCGCGQPQRGGRAGP